VTPPSDSPEIQSSIPWEKLTGQKIFLTGGTGFFGCNVLEAYTRAWDRERLDGLITVLTRNPGAFRIKAPHLAEHAGVEIIEGDLTNCKFKDPSWDFVIHAAVEPGEPLDLLERNLWATQRVLELARRGGARRVLFTSSGAVYGPQPAEISHLDEDYGGAPPLADSSAYGEAKRASELLGMLHGERHGFDFLIARGFAFLGSWLPLEGFSAAGNFIGDALAGRPIQVKGDGRPYRSYLHGEDLADCLWTILLRGVHGRPYNVGSGEAIRIADLAHRVRDLLSPGLEVRVALEPGKDLPPRYVPSVERARLELGFEPRISLDEAILRTAQWNRERP
jgi:nucleoside-diphosphate-sugar epimerase